MKFTVLVDSTQNGTEIFIFNLINFYSANNKSRAPSLFGLLKRLFQKNSIFLVSFLLKSLWSLLNLPALLHNLSINQK